MQKYDYYYFLGIGGIGMSALARFMKKQDSEVFGYDRTSTPLTAQLTQEGMVIGFEDSIEHIPEKIVQHKARSLIIYTPALPHNHQILHYLQKNKYTICKRSEALGMLTQSHFTVAVAGTHGKTTTSAMIAHLLYAAKKNMVAIVGGIIQGYESNFLIHGQPTRDTIFVVEADEFDRSFLRLHPNWAVITSAGADHLDIYKEQKTLEAAFKTFGELVPTNGKLCIQQAVAKKLFANNNALPIIKYALHGNNVRAENIQVCNGYFRFDYISPKHAIYNIALPISGEHNIENALAAITVCLALGLEENFIKKAFTSFKGIKRRFEYIIQQKNLVFIDDYAHHPTEIQTLLHSVKKLYPHKKITAVFQPHLYSRTKDFTEAFAQSLCLADEIFLLPIYPAREAPIAGVTSKCIFDRMHLAQKFLCKKDDLFDLLKKNTKLEIFVTIGAGDIAQLVQPLKKILHNKNIKS